MTSILLLLNAIGNWWLNYTLTRFGGVFFVKGSAYKSGFEKFSPRSPEGDNPGTARDLLGKSGKCKDAEFAEFFQGFSAFSATPRWNLDGWQLGF
jgi:hypothetical protein